MSVAHRSREWLRATFTCGALLACAALALPAHTAHADPHDPPAGEQSAPPGGSFTGPGEETTGNGTAEPPGDNGDPLSQETLRALLKRLQSLYRNAEEATEEYNGAREKLKKQKKAVKELTLRLAEQREKVGESRRFAGLLARRQYMDGGLSGYGELLLSDNPQQALERGHLLEQAAKMQAQTIADLQAEEQSLDRLTAGQKTALGKAAAYAKKQRAARDKVNEQLDRVERIVSSLTGAQREELRRLEEAGINATQAAFLRSGVLGTGSRGPSAAGGKAIAYAFNQLDDPYVWGAEGPDAFDCSGLTSQAWAHAGKPIPRTSQEQWKRLPKVPLNRLRPGDLVIYYPGATHVGMYIGRGMIVEAPRPGSQVKVSPIASMPVLGAVRPDPEGRSSSADRTPDIPEGGKKGSGKPKNP